MSIPAVAYGTLFLPISKAFSKEIHLMKVNSYIY